MDIERFHVGQGEHAKDLGPSELKNECRQARIDIKNLASSTPHETSQRLLLLVDAAEMIGNAWWERAGSAQQRSGSGSGGGTQGQRA